MLRLIFISTAFICSIFACEIGLAQDVVIIGDINISGNERTRKFVLNREMDFRSGDTIALEDFQQTLIRNENHLINTGLFASVKVAAPQWKNGDQRADIQIEVNETWYLFPIPVLKLADRNFNVWWEDFDRDFSRLIWGLRLHHYNLTGVKDYLKVVAEFGFSQRYQLRYRYPYLNKSKTLGLELETSFSRSRNGAYDTQNNQLEFLISEEKDNYRSFYAKAATKYRPKFYLTHEAGITFRSNSISDVVRDLNSQFHFDNQQAQRYFNFYYRFKNDRRDRRMQATSGYSFEALITQVGLGIYNDLNYGFVQAQIKNYIPLHKKITARVSTSGRWYFNREKISYNHSQALGYGSLYVRGYEHYVIDGTDFLLSHQGAVWEFYNRTFNLSKLLPFKKLNVVPIRLYFSLNVDIAHVNTAAYADTDGNPLTKQWLYGYGPALEVLLAEGYLFGVDYSINHFGESGVFLHTKFNF